MTIRWRGTRRFALSHVLSAGLGASAVKRGKPSCGCGTEHVHGNDPRTTLCLESEQSDPPPQESFLTPGGGMPGQN